MKYRIKPVEVEAVQFNKLGDHPDVQSVWKSPIGGLFFEKPTGRLDSGCWMVFCLDGAFGLSEVQIGDYIITDRIGTSVLPQEAFKALYVPIPEPRSGLYQCSSCGTIGEWSSWLSGAFHGVHQCDCCYIAGKQHVLIPCNQV